VKVNKVILSVVVLLVTVALLFGACAKPAPAPAPKPAPAPAPAPEPYKWPKGISIVTPDMQSGSYPEIAGWATELEKDVGLKMRLVPEKNTALSGRWHKMKEVDMMHQSEAGMIYIVSAAYFRPDRQDRDGGPYDVRGVTVRPVGYRLFFAATDSGIKSFDDIKKKAEAGEKVRMARFTNVPMFWNGLLEMLEITKDQVEFVDFSSFAATAKAVIEGHADVSWQTPVGGLAAQLEASPRGTTWLEFPTMEEDKGAIERFMKHFAFTTWGPVKNGVKGTLGINTMNSIGWTWGRADMDDGLAYNMIKWQMENLDKFKDKTGDSKLMNKETLEYNISVATLPVHNGVIKYCKELGIWKSQHDVRQMYNIWLIERYKDAYAAAIAEADKQGIEVDPENKVWLALWKKTGTEVHKLPSFAAMTDAQVKEAIAKYNVK